MRTCLLAVLAVLGTACQPAAVPPDAPWVPFPSARADAFQRALEGARDEQGLVGLAMAVADHRTHALWVSAVGSAEIDPDVPWTPERTTRIGSVSKTLTAAAVFQLAEEGALDLDDPLEAWVPGTWAGPTLRDLLGHSSGIASYNYVGGFDAAAAWTPTALVAWARAHEPALRFEPGTAWEYSNTNYVLLGLVLEEATGRSYEQVVRSRFLEPLDLGDTRLAHAGDASARLVHAYEGDPPVDVSDAADPSMGWAAGGYVSTPADLARWTAHLFGGDVLAPDSLALLTTPTGLTGPDQSEAGLGAFVEEDDGLAIHGHTGGITGYLSFAYHLEDPGTSLVILTNHHGADLRAASTWGWAAILDVPHP